MLKIKDAKRMTITQLKKYAAENDIKIPSSIKIKEEIINFILKDHSEIIYNILLVSDHNNPKNFTSILDSEFINSKEIKFLPLVLQTSQGKIKLMLIDNDVKNINSGINYSKIDAVVLFIDTTSNINLIKIKEQTEKLDQNGNYRLYLYVFTNKNQNINPELFEYLEKIRYSHGIEYSKDFHFLLFEEITKLLTGNDELEYTDKIKKTFKNKNNFLYRITQNINRDWDTFDSVIFCAPNETIARRINPKDSQIAKNDDEQLDEYSWTKPKYVHAELIGIAEDNQEVGVVLASFNSG